MSEPRYPRDSIADEPPTVIMSGISAEVYFTLSASRQPQNLIDGLLYASPPPSDEHEELVDTFVDALRQFALEHAGRVIRSPMPCWLSETTVIQPDAGFVTAERAGLAGRYVNGAPDLVIEVIAPGTRAFDTEAKFGAYGKNGVREAWFVDPEAGTVNVVRGDGSAWTSEQVVRFGEAIPSDVVDVGSAGLKRA